MTVEGAIRALLIWRAARLEARAERRLDGGIEDKARAEELRAKAAKLKTWGRRS